MLIIAHIQAQFFPAIELHQRCLSINAISDLSSSYGGCLSEANDAPTNGVHCKRVYFSGAFWGLLASARATMPPLRTWVMLKPTCLRPIAAIVARTPE